METFLLFSMSLIVLLFNCSSAQIPGVISHQDYIADSLGHPVVNGYYHLEFKFYSDSIGGSALLTVDQSSANVQGGIYNTTIDV